MIPPTTVSERNRHESTVLANTADYYTRSWGRLEMNYSLRQSVFNLNASVNASGPLWADMVIRTLRGTVSTPEAR